MKNEPLITGARKDFHNALLDGILTVSKTGIPNFADKDGAASVAIAKGIVGRIGKAITQEKEAGQTSGKKFEEAVGEYLRATFLKLDHLRPGSWEVRDRRSNKAVEISDFEQYEHLAKLVSLIESEPEIAAALGSDYLITPDVVILRTPESDECLNKPFRLVDDTYSRHTPIRRKNRTQTRPGPGGKNVDHAPQLLHASVSCKWTLRSDRAQNARSEALNLIRNRKGRVPHIVAITAEPVPSRIASLALGTSDLDCVYHVALPELISAVGDYVKVAKGDSEAMNMLMVLVNGKRLRDISDLPLDLAI